MLRCDLWPTLHYWYNCATWTDWLQIITYRFKAFPVVLALLSIISNNLHSFSSMQPRATRSECLLDWLCRYAKHKRIQHIARSPAGGHHICRTMAGRQCGWSASMCQHRTKLLKPIAHVGLPSKHHRFLEKRC